MLLVSAHRSKNGQSAPAPLPLLGEYPPLGKTGKIPSVTSRPSITGNKKAALSGGFYVWHKVPLGDG
ncbi:TPA: hypothetical protein NKR53_004056 [Vibrio parahaemolyticus]|nr:hypothetical protein AKH11_15400 [Vibrio parahaemolyticus]HCH2177340.1 hypothetical protein [Vibrio parahaemolyticus]